MHLSEAEQLGHPTEVVCHCYLPEGSGTSSESEREWGARLSGKGKHQVKGCKKRG